MKKIIFIASCLLIILFIPDLDKEKRPKEFITSPSGKYYISYSISVKKDDTIKCVKIHLYDSSKKELSTLHSGASDMMKWALGWMKERDIIVLYSSDIGTYGYKIGESYQLKRDEFENLIPRGVELKKEKYNFKK